MRCYRGNVFILGRSSETEKLYSEEESSMDSLVDFSPVDTSMSPPCTPIPNSTFGPNPQGPDYAAY